MLGLLGIKLGMTQIFTESGDSVAVTVIELPPATIMGLMTAEKDGYKAIKVTSGVAREKNMTKAIAGQFKSAGVAPGKDIIEFRLEDLSEWSVGKKYDVSIFASDKEVTVTGVTIGRGFAGTIKRHKFQRGPTTHGSQNTRQPGSIGAHTYPGRVFPGQRMAGHHVAKQQTTKNLDVIRVDVEKNLLFVRGAVPGHKNSKVIVRKQ